MWSSFVCGLFAHKFTFGLVGTKDQSIFYTFLLLCLLPPSWPTTSAFVAKVRAIFFFSWLFSCLSVKSLLDFERQLKNTAGRPRNPPYTRSHTQRNSPPPPPRFWRFHCIFLWSAPFVWLASLSLSLAHNRSDSTVVTSATIRFIFCSPTPQVEELLIKFASPSPQTCRLLYFVRQKSPAITNDEEFCKLVSTDWVIRRIKVTSKPNLRFRNLIDRFLKKQFLFRQQNFYPGSVRLEWILMSYFPICVCVSFVGHKLNTIENNWDKLNFLSSLQDGQTRVHLDTTSFVCFQCFLLGKKIRIFFCHWVSIKID